MANACALRLIFAATVPQTDSYMKNKATLRSSISQLVPLVLITLFVFTSGVATHRGGFIQTTENEIDRAKKAILEAQGALDKAEAKKSEALQATAEVEQVTKSKDLDQVALADLQSASLDLRHTDDDVADDR